MRVSYGVAINPMRGGDDPAVAQRTMESPRPTGNGVAARGHRIPSGPFENGGAVPNIDDSPAGNGCRFGFRRGHQDGCRHRVRGRCRIGLRGERPRVRWQQDGRFGNAADNGGARSQSTPMRFARLPPCRSILLRQCEGEGASFCATGQTPSSGWRTAGQFRPPAHPSAKLAASAAVTSTAARADRQMARAPPARHRDRDFRKSTGARAAATAGGEPRSPTRFQR